MNELQNYLEKAAQVDAHIHTFQRRSSFFSSEGKKIQWDPPFETYRVKDHLFVDVELPGVLPRSVKISIENNCLHINGEKPRPLEVRGGEDAIGNRHFGPFSCQFALPPGQAVVSMTKRFRNGVVHVKLEIGGAGAGRTS